MLEDESVDVNATTPKGITSLNLCLKNCSKHPKLMNMVWLLVEKGADVTTKTKDDGSTPLYSLCLNYKYDNLIFILDLLLQKGADVNAKLLGTHLELTEHSHHTTTSKVVDIKKNQIYKVT